MKIVLKQIEVRGSPKKVRAFRYREQWYEIVEVLDTWKDVGAWWEREEEKRFWRVCLHNGLAAEIFYIPGEKKWYLYRLW